MPSGVPVGQTGKALGHERLPGDLGEITLSVDGGIHLPQQKRLEGRYLVEEGRDVLHSAYQQNFV